MKCRLVVVGKLSDSFAREWVGEYEKRLTKYCAFEVVETKEQPTLDKERDLVLRLIPDGSVLVVLAIQGKILSSEVFADWLGKQSGKITFVIGSDKGLHQEVVQKAHLCLSFGSMTLPHKIARLVFTEQLYRAFSILKHEPYHK